ncbi:AzlD family protein [Mesorhizobium sp. M4B.F.Ca.ET.215.01.1.1]|uniref:AzlD family protein n=2 Tax=Mesorhizobium TaxID=68287 RepID=A0ABU5AWR0_9HYPH|nr:MULTISPECIES: AzlD family protein [Mesorhizobium]RVC55035.1 AzlD family protein [Mesorhizobium sp. M4B.F.Ca.ET.088.02.2.1]MDX8541764.1 AzlD family protein [Mesorhizobium abyssinicae]RUW21467.1 AzlD family protein [Mesorhizobium sp. M4B.F.Ca.ET.013.02.1.1]RUW67163.1 AzlD family protein [Mesorhizobium sp. M4B.F.Ca.ET.049.02.1.2]RVD37347.1 AzlD family protein [Mesorhizobium sp. M4B.F.Ca.ET.019.03.1.1]
MIDPANLIAIVLMASVTYLTRIGGYVVLRNRTLGRRATAVMEAAPGCVLISVIAPDFVSKNPADLAALAITLLAATRLSMLPTVVIGVASSGVLRWLMG